MNDSRLIRWAVLFLSLVLGSAAHAQVSQNLGNLANGESAIITFGVTINSPLSIAVSQISAQASATYNGSTTVNSDDPETAAADDATVTVLDQDFDYGDAPGPRVATAGKYPTRD